MFSAAGSQMTGRHHTGLAEACKKLTAGADKASLRDSAGGKTALFAAGNEAWYRKNGRWPFFPIKWCLRERSCRD
jgi:hypothetical protein